jgi:hypothetical protein
MLVGGRITVFGTATPIRLASTLLKNLSSADHRRVVDDDRAVHDGLQDRPVEGDVLADPIENQVDFRGSRAPPPTERLGDISVLARLMRSTSASGGALRP